MAKNKYEILDMINDNAITEALSIITANGITFTENELASHIDNMISANEEGEIDVDDRVALLKYLSEKGLTQQLVVEEYVTDPVAEKDTSKWLTNIYYVLK